MRWWITVRYSRKIDYYYIPFWIAASYISDINKNLIFGFKRLDQLLPDMTLYRWSTPHILTMVVCLGEKESAEMPINVLAEIFYDHTDAVLCLCQHHFRRAAGRDGRRLDGWTGGLGDRLAMMPDLFTFTKCPKSDVVARMWQTFNLISGSDTHSSQMLSSWLIVQAKTNEEPSYKELRCS